ncbi:MAG: transglycosylase domain-containing protein [Bacteroidota bacterium]
MQQFMASLRQKKIPWKKVGKLTLYGTIAGVVAIFVLILSVYWGAFGKIPTVGDLRNIENSLASEVYSANETLLGKYYFVNRTTVDYQDISPFLINALVATEDARFYQHRGVDMRSLGRVIVKSILLQNDNSGGGSTISQQLAKNLFPRKSFSFFSLPINKIREIFIARRLEQLYAKEEILELYLNTVPFGESVYGIGAATQRFFSTTPQKIQQQDGAVLVGMLKATTYYNPRKYPERAKKRRNVVLSQMVKYDYLAESKSTDLKALPLELKYKNVTRKDGRAPYFRQEVAKQVKRILSNYTKDDGSEWNMYRDGLKIYTTLDPRMQRYAEEAVEIHMASLQKSFDQHWKSRKLWDENDKAIIRAMKQSPRYQSLKRQGLSESQIMEEFKRPVNMNIWSWTGESVQEMSPLDSILYYKSFLQAGMLAMDPETGAIRAWVGGINFEHFKYDHVTANRQVGSTFKPFVYAAGIEKGLDPCEYIPNQKVTYPKYNNWSPGNADGKYEGYYSMMGGLVNSVNTVSAAVMKEVGVDTAWNFARRFGFESSLPKDPTLVLGTADLTLREMVSAYSGFANRGRVVKPFFIARIETHDGRVIVDFERQRKSSKDWRWQAMNPTEADMVAYMLRKVVDSGTAKRLRYTYKLRNQIAGKTGTTQDQTDGWFMGANPELVVGVWVGGDERKVRFRSLRLGQGANMALPIYGRFMQKVNGSGKYRNIRDAQFTNPSILAMEGLNCNMYVEKLPMDILDPFEMLIDQYRRNKERRDSIRMERERDRSQRGRDRKRNSLKDLFKKKKRERDTRYE